MRGIPVSAVMQMRKWAGLGVAINVVTGTLFFVGAPDQYIHNPAWKAKLLFLAVAIINVAIFETTQGKRMLALPADTATPTQLQNRGRGDRWRRGSSCSTSVACSHSSATRSRTLRHRGAARAAYCGGG
jgi:hypothetical protein